MIRLVYVSVSAIRIYEELIMCVLLDWHKTCCLIHMKIWA